MVNLIRIILFILISIELVQAKPFNDRYKFIGNISNEEMIIAHLELEALFQEGENGKIKSKVVCHDFQLNPCNSKNKLSFCSPETEHHHYNATNIAIARLQMDSDQFKNSSFVNELMGRHEEDETSHVISVQNETFKQKDIPLVYDTIGSDKDIRLRATVVINLSIKSTINNDSITNVDMQINKIHLENVIFENKSEAFDTELINNLLENAQFKAVFSAIKLTQ